MGRQTSGAGKGCFWRSSMALAEEPSGLLFTRSERPLRRNGSRVWSPFKFILHRRLIICGTRPVTTSRVWGRRFSGGFMSRLLKGGLALGGTVLALGALRRVRNPQPRDVALVEAGYAEFDKK